MHTPHSHAPSGFLNLSPNPANPDEPEEVVVVVEVEERGALLKV